MVSKKLIFTCLLELIFCSVAQANNPGPMLLGFFGSVVVHESGHALMTSALGSKVEVFRPYPTKAKFVNADGSSEVEWSWGLVKSSPFEGNEAPKKEAWVAAMGSVSNLISVFLFAPLLPEINSDFAKSSLDSMLFISSFDGVFYTASDIFSGSQTGDWSRVSNLTEVSLYWYFAANLAGGILANSYRNYWHHKAFPNDKYGSNISIGANLINIRF